jgi:hypothetical protein
VWRDKEFSIYFHGKWAQGCWPKEWADNGILADITFLELFPVVISVHIWGIHLKNKRIMFNVDNQAVVAIINKKSSKSNRVMTLVRNLVLLSLQYNIMLKAEHIPSKINSIADALSRSEFFGNLEILKFFENFELFKGILVLILVIFCIS